MGNHNINTDGNKAEISKAEAFSGEIYVSARSITELTGIEAFVNITSLKCSSNQLTSLYVSKNTLPTRLNFHNNKLLRALNLKNGNTGKFKDFLINNNTDLSCVQVDNAFFTKKWKNKFTNPGIIRKSCVVPVRNIDVARMRVKGYDHYKGGTLEMSATIAPKTATETRRCDLVGG